MKFFSHKIYAAVLLMASCIPFLFVVCFHVKQQVARYEMKEKLEENILHTITVSEKNVHWVKKNKEILVNGKMFDIKHFQAENGYFIFTGLYDEEETALNEEVNNNFNRNNKSGWLVTNLFQWLQTVYTTPFTNQLPVIMAVQHNPSFIFTTLTSPILTILTPPPRHFTL